MWESSESFFAQILNVWHLILSLFLTGCMMRVEQISLQNDGFSHSKWVEVEQDRFIKLILKLL